MLMDRMILRIARELGEVALTTTPAGEGKA